MPKTIISLIPPTGPDFVNLVERNLIQNAKAGAEPSFTRPDLRVLANLIVNESGMLPVSEVVADD